MISLRLALLGLASALVFACVACPVRAQDSGEPPAKPAAPEPATRLTELEKEVAQLRKQLDDLRAAHQKTADEIARAHADLKEIIQEGFRRQTDERLSVELSQQNLKRDLQDLTRQLDDLRAEVNRLRSEGQAERRSFAFNPAPAPVPPATTALGTLVFTNAFWMPMTVVLDGMAITLAPGETRSFSRAAGPFGYEVLGASAFVVRTLGAGQTFTVQIGSR
ncbi:MAG TPA: hypothetical protein PKD86_17115 [Gemmatales bacterium]|nr:hypothetical protein [Gemmatales bacterium]